MTRTVSCSSLTRMFCQSAHTLRIGFAVFAISAPCIPLNSLRADLIGPTLQISGAGCRFPDVAYGNVSRQYLVVWSDYTAANVRVFGRLMRPDGAPAGDAFPISDAAFGSLYPAVAFNPGGNEFLVTWDDGGARGGVIFGQRVRGSDGALLGANFPIGSVFGGIRSAVAWSPVSNCYLVVYWGPGNTAPEVYGRRVSGSGGLLGGQLNISNDALFSGYPAVAWASSANQFLITWDNDDGNIHGRRVNAADGTFLGATIFVTSGGGKDRSCIAYDPINPRWLVQYNDNANAGFSYDQYARVVNVDGSLAGGALSIAHTAGFEGDTQFGGDVAFEPGAQRFFSSFGTDTGMSGQESLASGAPRAPQVVLGTGFYTSLNNAADPDTHRFLTTWEGMLGGAFHVLGQLYAATLDAPASFVATPGDSQNVLAWRNPTDPHFVGTMIRVKTSGYPSGPTDGELVVDKTGSPGATDNFTHTNLTNWTTYYYAAFAHDNGPNYSLAAQALSTARPPAVTVSNSDFTTGTDGWTLDVWRSGTLGFGTTTWDNAAGNIAATGAGATNNNDACTREGSLMTRVISTAGRTSIQVEYDVMAALFAPPTGAPGGGCTVLEGTSEDKLVLYFSTTGANGPWTVAQTLTEGVELPTAWTRKLVNLAGVPGVANNPNFVLRFQWQFNHASDSGRVDNVRVLSGAVTSLTPAIGLQPGIFDRTVPAGSTLGGDFLRVSNTGEGTLSFVVTDNAPWLSVMFGTGTSAGPERTVLINYQTAAMPVGDYTGAIQVTSPDAANSPLTIPVNLHVIPPACLWEPFTYYDGNLTTMGGANWTGIAANEAAAENGALKLSGGSGTVTASRTVSCAGANNVIVAEIKVRGGTGTGDFFWSIYLDDSSGNNFARWYGGSRHARGRIGSTITADMVFSGPDVWDDLYVEIDTVANTSEFFFNGISFGALSHGATPAASIGAVRIERNDRPTAAADAIYFDDLSIGAVDPTLPRLNFMRSADQFVLTWPAVRRGATLETTLNLSPPITWSQVTNSIVTTNGQFRHNTAITSQNRFFRLRR